MRGERMEERREGGKRAKVRGETSFPALVRRAPTSLLNAITGRRGERDGGDRGSASEREREREGEREQDQDGDEGMKMRMRMEGRKGWEGSEAREAHCCRCYV